MGKINPFIPIDIDDYEIRKAWNDGYNAGYKSLGLTFILTLILILIIHIAILVKNFFPESTVICQKIIQLLLCHV